MMSYYRIISAGKLDIIYWEYQVYVGLQNY